jgi:NAD-dependent deacetylase
MHGLERLARRLATSRRTVVLTGAGMSTESGVPDYRSASGLWTRHRRFEELASVQALERWPDEFLAFYRARLRALAGVRPNDGHARLARWQRAGRIAALVTQNVDGLHEEAGSDPVIRLHGTLRRCRCAACGAEAPGEALLDDEGARCRGCGGRMRPSVVLFGEPLPEEAVAAAWAEAEAAELFVVLGSSLAVAPASLLPEAALEHGAALAIVNDEPTALSAVAHIDVRARIGPALAEIDRILDGG